MKHIRLFIKNGLNIAALMLCGAIPMITSCSDIFYDTDEETFEHVQDAIRQNKYDDALKILDKAKMHAQSSDDENIIEFNKAVINILKGSCDRAIEHLDKNSELIREYDEKHYKSALQHETDSSLSAIHATIYEAAAIAILCPKDYDKNLTYKDYEKAIAHLYHVIQHGFDRRNLLGLIYTKMFPKCQTLIPASQQNNNSPDEAFSVEPPHKAPSFTLCPGQGNWYKFNARKHEVLKLTIDMHPLEREFRPDDSSRLPYTRLHISLYGNRDGKIDFDNPLAAYIQPIPKTPPKTEDYLSMRIVPPSVELQENGVYYVHFRTEGNGEAHIRPVFKHDINCDHIDDIYTYTKDLKQTDYHFPVDKRVSDLFICPGRPDTYTLDLKAGQMAMLSIKSRDIRTFDDKTLKIAVKDPDGRTMQKLAVDDDSLRQSPKMYQVFRTMTPLPDDPAYIIYSTLILIENTTEKDGIYKVTLEGADIESGMRHSLYLAKSHECDGEVGEYLKIQEEALTFPKANDNEVTFLPPKWACPGSTYRYHPIIPDNANSINGIVFSNLVSKHGLRPEDLVMETTLILPPDNKEYLGESALVQKGKKWISPYDIYAYILQKPFLQNAQIRMRLSDEASGFILTRLLPPRKEEQSQEESRSQEKKEDKKRDSAQDQKSRSKDEEKADPTPQKPSETPAVPQGAGTDAQGNESTPTPEESDDKNAGQYDPNQTKRDYIDALLDAIEQGNLNVPIPGSAHETKTEKDW